MLDAIEETAVRACREGAAVLRERFREGETDLDHRDHDVKAAADRAAEAAMLPVVRSAFPDHPVYAEESGEHPGDGPYRWVVDPLDGTNNFAAGLPSFASAVAVLRDDEPVVAAVAVPLTDDLYVARRGGGVRHDGEQVTAETDRPVAQGTVAFVVGHDVKRDGRIETARAIHRHLDGACKRVVESWSPTVHWGLLARGRLDGMVAFHPDAEEQHAGELLAAEAGVGHERREHLYVGTANPDAFGPVLDAVERGLDEGSE